MLILAAILLVLLAFCGMPLYAVFGGAALLGYAVADVNFEAITVEIYRMVDTPLLLALPLFTFSGYLLGESRASSRLVELTQSLVGSMRGGLAVVAFVSCALFTAFTGACGVTIVALGALLLPAMLQQNYPEKFSLGLITTSGSLGLLLPPSLPLILYGIISQQMGVGQPFTLTQLFMAGILPALLMIVVLSAWSLFALRKEQLPTQPFSFLRLRKAVWAAKWELPMPLVVLACIYGGWLAVSEVAALVAFYVLIVEVFIYREVPLPVLPKVINESMVMVGGLLLILALSMAFTNTLIDAEVPTKLFEWIQRYVHSRWTFLLLLNIFLLLLGAIVEIFPALVIVVPLILPVAVAFGVHPVHLGIIFLANMQIGYFMPPVGMSLFIASYRFKKPVLLLFKSTLPFMLVLLFAVLVITYVPWLSLWMF
jgi:tripartite ATP-independent transporter DctM subunit